MQFTRTYSQSGSILCALALLASPLLSGCTKPEPVAYTLTWHEVIDDLVRLDKMARLDTSSTQIVTSYDRTGGNDDYNSFARKGPKGWVVLADLEGPGYITRFWFTGADDGSHPLRFYFDGEKTPRIDTTVGAFCGDQAPNLPPLASYENYCWYNLIPIPFEKKVTVMMREGAQRPGGWPRLFYQINYVQLPEGEAIASYPKTLLQEDRDRIAAVADAWTRKAFDPEDSRATAKVQRITVAPGATAWTESWDGPGVIERLEVEADFSSFPSPSAAADALRDIRILCEWDGADPSVDVPLGDFFGSVWQATRYSSMCFGMAGSTFFSRFPMPFSSTARVGFVNESASPVSLDVKARIDRRESLDPALGYFHAAWRRSTPAQVRSPHEVLIAKGEGKFVGCILSVTGMDKSWWILEGDETIAIDHAIDPPWKGTGLEDYFNGGWYYQNALAHPLHGLPFKAPFRTVQYRLHLNDPVHFEKAIRMGFERGPDHASNGYMESVAYYYLRKPAAAASVMERADQRHMPVDPMAQGTIMLELANLERLGDFHGASNAIDVFLERYPPFPFAAPLRLRKIAYAEQKQGFDAVKGDYASFIAAETNAAVARQARDLVWFHEDPSHALLAVYSCNRTAVFIDGRPVSSIEDPARVHVFRVKLGPGRHVLALQSAWKNYPSWVLVRLRTHQGDVGTGPSWKWAVGPAGDWKSAAFDDQPWPEVGGTGGKGPPEAPYIWTEPNGYMGVRASAVGLRLQDERWTDRGQRVVYRHTFEME